MIEERPTTGVKLRCQNVKLFLHEARVPYSLES